MDGVLALPKLQSEQSSARLQAISSARKKGIGEHIGLPQLIGCGDQSSGKSSVLEGITGFPFPRQDGLCTRFATEIVLQHEEELLNIVVSIIPHSSQTQDIRKQMTAFTRRITSFDELPQLIAEAGAIMGLKSFSNNSDGLAFAKDVLHIRVSGPTGLCISVVDLPGIIQVPNEEQTEWDVEAVHELVDSYMVNPRSIILAVVQAGNDISNQLVIQKCKRFDPLGERTIGIITKPDLINRQTESRVALLARNEDTTKLKLGFFLVKNLSPEEMEQDHSPEQREQKERSFFASAPWSHQNLIPHRVGVANLKHFLQTLLDHHIEKELPKVRQEIKAMQNSVLDQLAHLGNERHTPAEIRIYLSGLAMRFDGIYSSALGGDYSDRDFFDGSLEQVPPSRLRAVVHASNVAYADNMRTNGEKRRVVSDERAVREVELDASVSKQQDTEQLMITEAEMSTWITNIYMTTRGRELPGDYNHVFLAELFHQQSSRWLCLALDHLTHLHACLSRFLDGVISHITDEAHISRKLREIVFAAFENMKIHADEELKKIWEDEAQPPVTYNHYYTDNVQKARNDGARKALAKAMNETTSEDYGGRMHISNNNVDIQRLLSSLQSRITVNMDAQACDEARTALSAYYKVARKTFVDNVCRQVVERHLLRGLPGLFSPDRVAAWSDEELCAIAAESQERRDQRKSLQSLHTALKECSSELL